MLNLITAVPGSGKTLFLLRRVAEQAAKENRQVYYSGIPLTDKGKEVLDWTELEDPEKWYELPAGAIIVIDECQRVFPPRRTGTHIPKHVSQFETHRHQGFDVWLITQAPRLMDSHVRQLVNKHYHLKRIFGSSTAEVLAWDCCEELPNTTGASGRCLDKTKFIYPKEVYTWYKSAELHTHKMKLPKVVYKILFWFIFIVATITISLLYIKDLTNPKPKEGVQKVALGDNPVPAASAPSGIAPPQAVVQTPEQFQESLVPLDPDRPETAPRYAHLSTPTAMPRISGCIKSQVKCTCYTDQATVLTVSRNKCEEVIARGHFDEYRQPEQREQLDRQPFESRQYSPSLQAEADPGINAITVPDTRQKTPNMM